MEGLFQVLLKLKDRAPLTAEECELILHALTTPGAVAQEAHARAGGHPGLFQLARDEHGALRSLTVLVLDPDDAQVGRVLAAAFPGVPGLPEHWREMGEPERGELLA